MLKEIILWIILGIIGSLLLFAMKIPEIIHSMGWYDLELWFWKIHSIIIALIFSAIVLAKEEEAER